MAVNCKGPLYVYVESYICRDKDKRLCIVV